MKKKLSIKQKRVLAKGQACRNIRCAIGIVDHLIKTNDFIFEDGTIVDTLTTIYYQLKIVDDLVTRKEV